MLSSATFLKSDRTTNLKSRADPSGGKGREGRIWLGEELRHPVDHHVQIKGRFRRQAGQRDYGGKVARFVGCYGIGDKVGLKGRVSAVAECDTGGRVGADKDLRVGSGHPATTGPWVSTCARANPAAI